MFYSRTFAKSYFISPYIYIYYIIIIIIINNNNIYRHHISSVELLCHWFHGSSTIQGRLAHLHQVLLYIVCIFYIYVCLYLYVCIHIYICMYAYRFVVLNLHHSHTLFLFSLIALSETNLYFKGLSLHDNDATIRFMCEPFGEIVSCKAIMNTASTFCKGICPLKHKTHTTCFCYWILFIYTLLIFLKMKYARLWFR